MMYINKMGMMYINKMSMMYINKMSMIMSMMYIDVYITVGQVWSLNITSN